MAGLHRTHALKACILIVGPTRITEFGESDALSIEPNSDMAEISVSADGSPTVVATNDDTMIASITVRQTGFAYRTLSALVQAQDVALKTTGLIPFVPFTFVNPATGDQVSDIGIVFLNKPGFMANKGVGDVVFRVALTRPLPIHGATITPAV